MAEYKGDSAQPGFDVGKLFDIVNDATKEVSNKLDKMKEAKDSISITDMLEMQMLMNHLSQLSEASTNVTSASNNAILSMARNVK